MTVFFLQHLKNIVALSFVLHGLWWDSQCNSNCFSSIGKNVMFLKLLLRCFSFSLVFRILIIMWLCFDFFFVYSVWDFSLLLESIGLFFCQVSEFFCHYFFSFSSLTSFSSVLTTSLLEPLNRVSGTLFIFFLSVFSLCFFCLFVFCFFVFVFVFSLLQTG